MNEKRPTHLDMFSGIGGFALAFQREGFRTIGHAEVEPFACAVYHEHFPSSICFGGVQNVTRDSILERYVELPTVITGGFPCQPHSLAGKRKASADERDLWSECKRVLGDIRPRFALFENVGGLLTSEQGLFYNRVLSDLAEIRFACLWQVVSAADVGAPHRRERVWMLCVDELADCQHDGSEVRYTQHSKPNQQEKANHALSCGEDGDWPSRPGQPQFAWEPPRVVADSQRVREPQPQGSITDERGRTGDEGFGVVGNPEHAGLDAAKVSGEHSTRNGSDAGGQESGGEPARSSDGELENTNNGRRGEREPQREQVCWTSPANEGAECEIESALGRLPNGLSAAMVRAWPQVHNRVGQLKGYGNAIVPQVAQIFARAIRNQIA